MFAVISKARRLHLPIDIQIQLFDSIVVPILLYGSEVSGFENCNVLKRLCIQFGKLILKAKKSTPDTMLYGELGHMLLVFLPRLDWGWLGVAKVTGILPHWGVQLILASSRARPAILLAGKGRGGMFLFLLFLHFHSCYSFFPDPLFHLLYYLFYIFSPFLWDDTK